MPLGENCPKMLNNAQKVDASDQAGSINSRQRGNICAEIIYFGDI